MCASTRSGSANGSPRRCQAPRAARALPRCARARSRADSHLVSRQAARGFGRSRLLRLRADSASAKPDSSAWRSAARPGFSRGPRSTARSRLRAARRASSRPHARTPRADASGARAAFRAAHPFSAVSATSRARIPGGVRRERPAGGIVDVDPPALQLDRDPARQAAIRRDERGNLARRLGTSRRSRTATASASSRSFAASISPMPAERLLLSRAVETSALAPALGGARRAHRLGYETIAGCEPCACLPQRNDRIARATPIALQQQLQAILRMPGARRLVLADADRVPAFRVETLVETRAGRRRRSASRRSRQAVRRSPAPSRSNPRR